MRGWLRVVRQVLLGTFDRRKNQILAHFRCENAACAPNIENRLGAHGQSTSDL